MSLFDAVAVSEGIWIGLRGGGVNWRIYETKKAENQLCWLRTHKSDMK